MIMNSLLKSCQESRRDSKKKTDKTRTRQIQRLSATSVSLQIEDQRGIVSYFRVEREKRIHEIQASWTEFVTVPFFQMRFSLKVLNEIIHFL